jgi:hypothetical protein
LAFLDFLRAALTEGNDVRLSSGESRMQFDDTHGQTVYILSEPMYHFWYTTAP